MLTVYADGTAYITTRNYSPQKEKLKPGEGSNVGNWGGNARRTFIARSAYLGNVGGLKCRTFILTYRSGNIPTAKESKSHINAFLQYLRRRGLIGYTYAAELGEKSRNLHYHFLAAFDYTSAKDINDAWCKIRGDYSKNAVRAYRSLEKIYGAAGYASKGAAYASKCAEEMKEKGEKFELPKEMRLWATSNNLVGKEKVSFDDANISALAMIRCKSFKKCDLDNGYELVMLWLDKKETAALYALDKRFKDETLAKAKKAQEKALKRELAKSQMKIPTFEKTYF